MLHKHAKRREIGEGEACTGAARTNLVTGCVGAGTAGGLGSSRGGCGNAFAPILCLRARARTVYATNSAAPVVSAIVTGHRMPARLREEVRGRRVKT